jgi:pilus assembly protein Flp/PilA
MLKFYTQTSEALKRLRADKNGVVSFEYVIVAACVVGAVIAAFGTGANSSIQTALTTVLGLITTAVSGVTVAAS